MNVRIINKELMVGNDIWKEVPDQNKDSAKKVYHIWSAIDLKKMIPVIDSVIKEVNINFDKNDTIEEKLYKDLLQNEYNFCIRIIDSIISRANKVYDKQINKKNGLKFCCDFKALERFIKTLS